MTRLQEIMQQSKREGAGDGYLAALARCHVVWEDDFALELAAPDDSKLLGLAHNVGATIRKDTLVRGPGRVGRHEHNAAHRCFEADHVPA